jgi:hypothetical protein
MELTGRLAGFIAAHGIYSIEHGDPLITMLCLERADGKRDLNRLVMERIEDSVTEGRAQLDGNPQRAARAALAFDGYLRMSGEMTDAIFVEAREYTAAGALTFEIAIPYQPAGEPGGLRVYRPKLLKVPPGLETRPVLQEFWNGVDSHAEGSAFWNAHIDQSR